VYQLNTCIIMHQLQLWQHGLIVSRGLVQRSTSELGRRAVTTSSSSSARSSIKIRNKSQRWSCRTKTINEAAGIDVRSLNVHAQQQQSAFTGMPYSGRATTPIGSTATRALHGGRSGIVISGSWSKNKFQRMASDNVSTLECCYFSTNTDDERTPNDDDGAPASFDSITTEIKSPSLSSLLLDDTVSSSSSSPMMSGNDDFLTPTTAEDSLSALLSRDVDESNGNTASKIGTDNTESFTSLSDMLGESSSNIVSDNSHNNNEGLSFSLLGNENKMSSWEAKIRHMKMDDEGEFPKIDRQELKDLLEVFDPEEQHDPKQIEKNPLAYQLWLECESQRDSVLNYEAMIGKARDRKNFTALSIVQRQLLQFYEPLRNVIELEQRAYFLSSTSPAEEASTFIQKCNTVKYSAQSHGPYLALLQPEKLAVIVAHEVTLATLRHGGSAALGSLALQVGEAVEAEVNVQKLMSVRKTQASKRKKLRKAAEGNNTDEDKDAKADISNETAGSDTSSGTVQSLYPMYRESNLLQFIEDASRLDASATKTQKLQIAKANKRAKKLLKNDDEWPMAAKARLGAALIQMLLDSATLEDSLLRQRGRGREKHYDGSNAGSFASSSVFGDPDACNDDGDNDTFGGTPMNDHTENDNTANSNENDLYDDTKAFRHEKKWVARTKSVGFITLDPELFAKIVEDKMGGGAGLLSTYATRFQPMIVPPKPWRSHEEGAYFALSASLMRTRGCKPQKEALQLAPLNVVFNALNALGAVPWKINTKILAAAKLCWEEGIVLGDIPSKTDFELPPFPIKPPFPEGLDFRNVDRESPLYEAQMERFLEFNIKMRRYRKMAQKNMVRSGIYMSIYVCNNNEN
jgi:hypothetical protein